ncbi:MAG: hypothetical protein P4M12_02645 [Gammaproteobacteria bacterium]|nr:hypothetical protein [Gammaproteobacteria bacterium]
MKRHKKPISLEPSRFLAKFAEEIAANSSGLIADIACGYGRNAACLASFGADILCVDNNIEALECICSLASEMKRIHSKPCLSTLNLDLINAPWPFTKESLGAIINIHFFMPNLLDLFLYSLKIGGYLFIETIDGHGGNYLQLPRYGFVKAKLADMVRIIYYSEKKVGPPQSDASTLKLFAQKK